ncbi:hypothetical protein AN639_11245 [Candidatus Epulonipiscium fishelsonii]|uniref:Uncharacterized protein n=1 Tax=Candidatus Epulonipiscium fishelsonii TaxID=77094 RepID=A0ACC8X8W4_9FIRM|nr:hypothetical protein AN396_10305 [Epulopiscium sp. SCG-B11WGA-EpuloA1]ONI43165.1 hypothetical protein AN639_11245 [Epulopiscium sp. SCG-B05WGA-EpuloA1]
MKRLLYILITISITLSLFISWHRIIAEKNQNNIQIGIRYEDLVAMSLDEDKKIEELLNEFKDRSVTTILFKQKDFNYNDLQMASDMGFIVSPELEDNTQIEKLRQIENLGYIFFGNSQIDTTPALIEFVSQYGLGFIEFFSQDQAGFDELAEATKDENGRYQVIRMYSDEKVPSISTPDTVDRLELALTERNIKMFVFVYEDPKSLYSDLSEFIYRARTKGYVICDEKLEYTYQQTPKIFLVFIGLSTVAFSILLSISLGIKKIGITLSCLMAIAYIAGLFIEKDIVLQGMALITSIVFPVYAIVKFCSESNTSKDVIKNFIQVLITTLIGASTIVGLLSHANYNLGLDGFRGVKLAHVAPLIITAVIVLYINHKQILNELKNLRIKKSILITCCILAGIFGAGVVIVYITRTGNGEISDIEKVFRSALDNLLGIRPRTKEFLIGYPALLVGLYFNLKIIKCPAIIIGTIGPISLINTFAHLHTPLMVSIIRSIYSVGFGVIIGGILIYFLKFSFKI